MKKQSPARAIGAADGTGGVPLPHRALLAAIVNHADDAIMTVTPDDFIVTS